ncbi:MAG: SDR family oxidoreductase [Stappiaceae bacterium]
MEKIAIITGGSRGIGAETALLAAKSGYDVCISYLNDTHAADAVVANCRAQGRNACSVRANVAYPDDVRLLFSTCDAELGPVSLLVNNAGIIGQATPLVGLSPSALQDTFSVNVFGVVYCAQQAIRRMAISEGGLGGVIINISSIAAVQGSPGEYVHYAASKGAVETLTTGLSKEVGGEGIRVNAIRSGTINTDIHRTSGNPDRPAMIARTAPLGRAGEPGDIAEAVLWLASDKSAYTTGAILTVSGGV